MLRGLLQKAEIWRKISKGLFTAIERDDSGIKLGSSFEHFIQEKKQGVHGYAKLRINFLITFNRIETGRGANFINTNLNNDNSLG
jgi:hypothetical protein